MTRLLTRFGMFLVIVNFYPLHAQDDFIKMMNDTIHCIKYVFEARIDSVHTYPGDKNGIQISNAKANWSGGAGNFEAIAYSKVWVSVCRVYKGKLPEKMILVISNPYVSVYAWARPGGDTTLSYIHNPPSHSDPESPLLPSKSYPITNLYWCYDVLPMSTTGFYKISKFFHSPMKIPGSIPNSHGSHDFGIIYAWVGTKTFMKQEELSNYLRQIKTLKPSLRAYCE